MHERPYEKLIVWQEAYKLCLFVYKLTIKFPIHERFGLASQMRRSSYSVPNNIAEGNSKKSSKEKGHFFETAHASLEELHCESRLSKDLNYINEQEYNDADDRIQRVSYLLTKLRASIG
jgi:four helix bundle protein